MANKTILSTVFNNQELLWKITSGLNNKANNLSGAVSGILDDYTKLQGATAGIATTLIGLSNNTQAAFNEVSGATTGIIDTRIGSAKTELTGIISDVSAVLTGKISDVAGDLAQEVIDRKAAITGVQEEIKDATSGLTETISTVSTVIETQISGAFGDGAKVVVSKDGGITKSDVVIGGATLAESPLSTTLATEAAVRTAIDSKSISLVGQEAIGVSGDLDKTAYLKIDGNDKVLTQSDAGLLTTIGLSSIAPTSAVYAKSYCLVGVNGQQLGDTVIDIPKDQFLSGVVYDPATQKLTLVMFLADGSTTSTTIELSGLVNIYEAASGIELLADGKTFVGKIDGNSEKSLLTNVSYLTTNAEGFSVSGINDVVKAASAHAYDTALADAKAYTDIASGALQGSIDTINGKLAGIDTTVTGYVATEIEKVNQGAAALSGRVDTLESNVASLTTQVGENTDKLSGITDTVTGYVSTNYVTKEVFGDIASNTKA